MKLAGKIVVCVVGIEAAGIAGGLLTAGAIQGWYDTLAKPPGTPPNAVFGPVWTTLYALMGVALARVWHIGRPHDPEKRRAITAFMIQFALNLAWTPVFFGARLPGPALVVIALLVATLAWTIRNFHRIDRPAAWLLVPYLIWVCYATYLNAGIWWLNR